MDDKLKALAELEQARKDPAQAAYVKIGAVSEKLSGEIAGSSETVIEAVREAASAVLDEVKKKPSNIEFTYDLTPEETEALRGPKGDPGEPGADADEEEIIDRVIPEVLKAVPTAEEVAALVVVPDPIPGLPGAPGLPGRDGTAIEPDEVVDKVNASSKKIARERLDLPDTDPSIARIDKQIANLDKRTQFLGNRKVVKSVNGSAPDENGNVTVSAGTSGDRYRTSSTSTVTITSTGTVTFQVDSGLAYTPLQDITAYHDTSNYMSGEVVSYSGTTLVMDVKHKTGSGTHSSWTINLDGVPISAITGATDSSLTVTGTTIGLNLSNPNTWAAQQTFSQNPILSAMTPGSVPFFGASGLLSQDNQNFFWDDTNDRLSLFTTLGNELLTNPNFTGSAVAWTVGSGWAYSSNSVSKTSNGTASLSQSVALAPLREYLLTYTVSNLTVGTVNVTLTMASGSYTGPTRSENGTYTERIHLAFPATALNFVPSNTARLTVDSVSLKPLKGTNTKSNLNVGGQTVEGEWSNGTPGTTRALTFSNDGSYTWTDYRFAGTLRAAYGVNSSGGVDTYFSGGNGAAWYSGNSGLTSSSLAAYLTSVLFAHYGYGGFIGGVYAGSHSSPHTKLQSSAGLATGTAWKFASFTEDGTANTYFCDATTPACVGTPSSACSSYTNQTDCEARDAHGGCSWFAGNPCSAFDNESGMGTCAGTSGCSVVTSSCEGASDQTSCEAQDDSYGGSCSWGATGDCTALDEGTCNSYAGQCTTNMTACTWDGMSDCYGNAACDAADNTDQATCEAITYFSSCTGTYNTCSGTYNTGSCTGTYGAACSGTASCAGIDDSTSCGGESGCSWVTALTVTMPSAATYIGRTVNIYNASSTGADVVVSPTGSDTINLTTSYTLASYKDKATFQAAADVRSCTGLSEGACSGQTGCSVSTSNCSWDSGSSTCSGHASCAGYGDQSSCEAATYYSGCYGSYTARKGWFLIGT